MPKYLDESGLIHFYDNIVDKPVRSFETVVAMQAATDLKSGMTCHTNGFHASGDGGAAYYSIGASGNIALANGLYATLVQTGGAKAISIEQLETVSAGVYTLSTVQVDRPIQLPRQVNTQIIIVDTVFNINTPVLFPSFSTGYFILPSFVGCIFNNITNSRVLITSGSSNTIGSRVTGCNFVDVDFVDGGYLQDFNFTACQLNSYDTFLDSPSNTVQARFVNCNAESNCNVLVDASESHLYFSGTYEGNSAKDYFFVNIGHGTVEFESCWFEGTKMLSINGGDSSSAQSVVNVNSCSVIGAKSGTPVLTAVHPEYVSLFINGSKFSPYDRNSRFTDATLSTFKTVIGNFITPAYGFPIGGESGSSKQYATVADIDALERNRFIQYVCSLSRTTIDGGGITYTLPVGRYMLVVGSVDNRIIKHAIFGLLSASSAPGTNTELLKLIDSTNNYMTGLQFTATKVNADDTTFTLNVNTTYLPNTYIIFLLRMD